MTAVTHKSESQEEEPAIVTVSDFDRFERQENARERIAIFLATSVTRHEGSDPEITVMPQEPYRVLKIASSFNEIADAPLSRPLPHDRVMTLAEFACLQATLNQQPPVQEVMEHVFEALSQGL